MSAAAGAAAAATIAAQAAHKAACAALVRGYQHDAATVEQAQAYAGCVQTLYPAEMGPDAVVAFKVVVAILIVSFFAGAVWGWLDAGYRKIQDSLMGALLGLSVALLGMLLLAGLWFGVRFLLS